jgi:hypothetical protein
LYEIAIFRGLAREILVLEPPIEDQPFVESRFGDGRHSERHVAAVQIRNARHDERIVSLASDEKPGFPPRNRLAFRAIVHDEAIGARDVRRRRQFDIGGAGCRNYNDRGRLRLAFQQTQQFRERLRPPLCCNNDRHANLRDGLQTLQYRVHSAPQESVRSGRARQRIIVDL